MNFLPLRFYIVASFINFITPFILGFALLKNFRSKPSRLFSLFSFAVAGWALFYCIWLLSDDKDLAEYYLRTCMIGVIFMPSLFIHFVTEFIKKTKSTKFYVLNYLLSIIFMLTVYTPLYAKNPEKFLVFPYWLHTGPVFHLVISHFAIIVTYSLWLMHKELKSAKGIFRNQLLYIYIGTTIGYVGGSTNYFCWYRIPIPPFLNACVAVYVLFIAYAIIRYKLLDIHFVIKRSITNIILIGALSTLILIESLFIGLTGLKILFVVLISTLTVVFLPKLKIRTENTVNHIFYKEKYKYQGRLEKFIEDMMLIPKEEDLLRDTSNNLAEILGVKKIAIFIFDHVMGDYNLNTHIGLDGIKDLRIPGDIGIAAWLKNHREIFIKEEIEKILDKTELAPIKETMGKLSAFVCIPVLLETDLLGFITLGEKSSGEMYSHLDTGILRRLGIQLAISLDYKRVEAELQKKHEYAAIGQLAFEITHEMKNLLVPINTFMQLLPEKLNDSEFINTMSRFSKANVDAINRKVEDILYFGQEQKLNLSAGLDINKLLSDTAEGLRPLAEKDNIPIVEELGDIPKIIADEELLLHVFNNLIMNAIDAMKNRIGKIRIRTQRHPDPSIQMKQISPRWIRIEVKDDGEGIPDKVKEKMFDAFITTKSGGGMLQKRGMGLGLTIVKKIVDQHHGVVGVNSSVGKGTTFIVDLPVEQRG